MLLLFRYFNYASKNWNLHKKPQSNTLCGGGNFVAVGQNDVSYVIKKLQLTR